MTHGHIPVSISNAPRPLMLKQVCDFTGLGRATVYEHERKGTFPRRVKIGRKSAWLSDEIAAWVESVRKARDDGAAEPQFKRCSAIAAKAVAGRKRRLTPPSERAA